MAESNTYVGVVGTSDALHKGTYQTLTSKTARISKGVQWAVFNKTPFLKAVGVEAFGVEGMQDVNKFGAATPSGRIIRYDSGKYAVTGEVFATTGTSFHTGRMGSFNPELVEGGDQWAYSWHKINNVQYIPVTDVQDNSDGFIDIKAQKMEGMKQKYVEDFNYLILGDTTNGPDAGALGASSVNSDLANLISKDQTEDVGGISKSGNTYWNNGAKEIATIGGGGEFDRPLILRRSLLDAKMDQQQFAEATDDYLFLLTKGAWQLYDRLMYADSVQGRNGGAFGSFSKYDAAGIRHFAFDGSPMVWDPATVLPIGATASTNAIYGIHIPSFFISIRSEENFLVSDWEAPREHDQFKSYVASIQTRYTPGVSAMRPHFVAYDLPASND